MGGRGLAAVCCISVPPMLWFPATFQVIASATVAPPARCRPLSEKVCATRAQLASTRTAKCSFFLLRVLPLRFFQLRFPVSERMHGATMVFGQEELRTRSRPSNCSRRKGEKRGRHWFFDLFIPQAATWGRNRILRQRNARQRRHESDRTWSGHIIHLIFSFCTRPASDETKWLVTRGRAPATIDGEDPPSISSVICLSMDPGPIHFWVCGRKVA
jgi:hypothetical protein